MNSATYYPLWAVVVACGAFGQIVKVLVYSAANRRFELGVLGQSHGLPSLPAAALTCLLASVGLRTGWTSSEAGFVLVFAVIAIHDTVKLRAAASRQREVLHRLVNALPEAGPFRQRVADYLDPRSHHPVHVAVGGLLGALFGVAFGIRAG